MPYPQVERRNVQNALKRIDAEGIPHARGATRYSLVVRKPNGSKECYPPKLVLSYAAQDATGTPLDPGEFSGGVHHTNRIFERLGYFIEKTGPFLCIQSPHCLEKMGKLEGAQWVRQQRSQGVALDNSYALSLLAYKMLRQMGADADGMKLSDLDPKAGVILGASGSAYVVFPDGEIALVGETATEAQKQVAQTMMQIV